MVYRKTCDNDDTQSKVDLAEEIFTRHGDFIRSVIRFQVKDIQKIEDLYQDFFLCLVAKPIPPDIQNTRAFLYRVICSRVKDAIRSSKRRKIRLVKYTVHKTENAQEDPSSTIVRTEELEKMFELIRQKLSKREALAVMLKYKHNCKTSEVAEKMKLDPRTVSRYISIALKKLRGAHNAKRENLYDIE